jgi:OOP family OmpA-OmpF porin
MLTFRVVITGFLATVVSVAQAQMPANDTVKGGKDHPLLTRFAGAKLVGYEVKQFDEATLPAGKRVRIAGKLGFEKTLRLEGKYTRIAYVYPQDRSSLEVMRNYQAALEKAGMKSTFACAKETCGENFGDFVQQQRVGYNFIQGGEAATSPFNYGRNDNRYLLASGTRPDGSALTVAVYAVDPVQGKNGGVYLDIVEGKPMEGGKVAADLNAADMAKGIATDGKVAIYGVYFDTGKADVKPESAAALAEMATMLKQSPKLKVFVVGHTDNQGAVAQNLALSQRRAESVIGALASTYKIDAARLSPKGVAAYAPLASNRAEAGRQQNRRVELVEQ